MGWTENAWEQVVYGGKVTAYAATGTVIALPYAIGGLINEATGGHTATYNVFEAAAPPRPPGWGHRPWLPSRAPENVVSDFTRVAGLPAALVPGRPSRRQREYVEEKSQNVRDAIDDAIQNVKDAIDDALPDIPWDMIGWGAAAVVAALVLKK